MKRDLSSLAFNTKSFYEDDSIFLHIFYTFLALLFSATIFISVPKASFAGSHEEAASEEPADGEKMSDEKDKEADKMKEGEASESEEAKSSDK